MVEAYTGFIDKKYKPKSKDVLVEYHVESSGEAFKTVIQKVAGESSIGTWTKLTTSKDRIVKNLKPSIYDYNEKEKTVKIAYPQELFELNSIPSFLSSIGGNVFGMKAVKNLRMEDISFPKSVIDAFKGPKYGVGGVRKFLKVKKRPLVGTIVKPKVGLTEKEHAKVAYNSWLGGCDVVKDDENLTSMTYNNFYKRIKETLKLKGIVEEETGEKKGYLANVTAPYSEMIKRAKYVQSLGGEYIMVDVVSLGWSAVQSLREMGLKVRYHAHRAGHASFTRNKKHGISMLTLAKISRLVGMDQLHIGTVVGKMEGNKNEVLAIHENINAKKVKENNKLHVLSQDWGKIKPMFSVASGGLHPGNVTELVNNFGNDVIMNFGGGIHGHPHGTIVGAKAARQAVEAVMEGISLDDYAKMHLPLKVALKKWGKKHIK